MAKLVISGILSSVFFILALYTSFLTTLFFTTLLSLLKSTGVAFNLLMSNLCTFLIHQYLIYLHQILNEVNQFLFSEK